MLSLCNKLFIHHYLSENMLVCEFLVTSLFYHVDVRQLLLQKVIHTFLHMVTGQGQYFGTFSYILSNRI